MDENLSTKAPMWCIVALVWFAMTATGCAERDSTEADNRQTSDATSQSVKAPITRRIRDAEYAGTTISTPKNSDGCEASTLAPGAHDLSLRHGGWLRRFIMTVPDSANGQTLAHPLLIAMHGFGGNGESMRNMLGHNNGFEAEHVVLYPDGAGFKNSTRGWNSGHPQCCGTALHNNVDDVAFLRTLVDTVAQDTCIDLNRVYATGFSNGGDMAQRLACDASNLVAAVTSVVGRFDYHASACPGERSVPAVLYRGLLDRTVPYEKGLRSLMAIQTIPAIDGFRRIARNHGCQGSIINATATENTICTRLDDCDDGFEITLCTSSEAGHCWPGIGNCSKTRNGDAVEFSASDHMRNFFEHRAMSP